MSGLSAFESWEENNSYEIMTDMEADFLIDLFQAIETMLLNGDKISLPRLAVWLNVTIKDVEDYIPEINAMINNIDPKYFEDEQ